MASRAKAPTWESAVESFREECGPLSAVYVADNQNAMRVVAVWGYQVLAYTHMGAPPSKRNELWDWAWACTSWDSAGLSSAAGVHRKACEAAMRALIGTRALFPDGTVSPYAEQVVRLHLATVLDKRPKGKR